MQPVSINSAPATPRSRGLTTWRLVTAAMLVGITIVLGVVPGVGFIPLPNIAGNATIEHVPTILGSVLEGPIVGTITGLTFGLLSFIRATDPFFKDPMVSIVPRLFIGITPWLVFVPLKRIQLDLASAVAGIVGSLTNTVLVLTAIHFRFNIDAALFVPLIPQIIGEAIVAAIITVVITRAVTIVRSRVLRAPDTKPRDKMAY